MKRLGSSDSLGDALMSICPTTTTTATEDQGNNHLYTRDFQTMMMEGLDEEGCVEETGHIPEKKRRLSLEQVKALEKYFEVENKLEPERKVKLAQELGLQPRQVAVWFQNRRARWKTKQLERDYGILKASYDSLNHNYDNLKKDNESLLKEIRELKAKLQDENSGSKVVVVKEEAMLSENEKQATEQVKCDDTTEINLESFNSNNGGVMGVSIFMDFKDGSSDSDSSGILNEADNNNRSPNGVNSSSGGVPPRSQSPHQFLIASTNGGSSGFQFLESKLILEDAEKAYQPQFVKIEEHNFFSGEDSCTTFFSDDQPPTLHWYNPDEWN